jgi:hypothetical protein
MLNDIYTKGFVQLSEPDGLDIIKINDFTLLNTEERSRDNTKADLNSELSRRVSSFGYYLFSKYVLPEWPAATFKDYIVWDGVDNDNQGWHSDMFEDYDVFFLYYLDDTSLETGGAINFKWGVIEDKEESVSIQPKAGDLFLVNNGRGFWHRADSTSITRRVASFDFNTNSGTIK